MTAFEDIRNNALNEWNRLLSSNRTLIFLGSATCGRAAGALGILKTINESLQTLDKPADVIQVGCLGPCYAEPIMGITKPGTSQIIYANLTPELTAEIIKDYLVENNPRSDLAFGYIGTKAVDGIPNLFDTPVFKGQVRSILRNCGIIDPEKINHYIAQGGYSGLTKALLQSPESIIQEVRQAGLRGRGGAGFSTAQKWELCRKSPGKTKYIICNADEGDPGAFMNRSLLEGDPHSVLEGMVIGAYAIGAGEGYIYCRAEYPLALERLRIAIKQMEELGLLGNNILGSGFSFHLHVKEGAGAFVCGEETALMASIEGERGMPRPRPPFPAVSGLWGKPTNINNVETWANTALIFQKGTDYYSQYGSSLSKGTKTFALVGKVERTGLVEVPFGTTLRDIIFGIGGGILKGKKFKAVQTGGPAGGCLSPAMLDSPVDYETLAKAGSIIGSGGVIVADENTCVVDLAKYFLTFTQAESCGKCTPCRVGTRQMLDVLERITRGEATIDDLEKLEKIALTVSKGSLCGLGQNAPNPVYTTLKYFRDEYEEHIIEKHCRAAVCKGLVIAPCSHTCPAGINVPRYIAQIGDGDYAGAMETIRERNPFPAVCGYICSHPCESKCRRGELDAPVAIRALKRYAADWYFEHLDEVPAPKPFLITRREKIAIVGAGPAGLTCAYFLVKSGYKVIVFESSSTGGGMLSSAIPDFRLASTALQQDIDYITASGVEIKYNTALGEKLTIDDLRKEYAAVFIAAGAQKSQSLGIPGESENIKGFYYGLNFLNEAKKNRNMPIGGVVAVIGGGNVAVDAARTALRLGAKVVNLYYRRSREEMPVSDNEYEEAVVEGIRMNFLVSPSQVVSNGGKVTGLVFTRMELGAADSSGRRQPVAIPDSDFTQKADTVIAAVGQAIDLSFLGQKELEGVKGKTLAVNANTLATILPGIFAGGDFVTGPGMVIDAISMGRRAAIAIDKYISRDLSPVQMHDSRTAFTPAARVSEEVTPSQELRQEMAVLAVSKRKKKFDVVELGYTERKAKKETRRCLRCDLE